MSIGRAIGIGLAWEAFDWVIDRAATPPEKPTPQQWCQKREGRNDGRWRRPRKTGRAVRG